LSAIFTDALEVISQGPPPRFNSQQWKDYTGAIQWAFSKPVPGDDRFSFEDVCGILGHDPDYLRKRLRKIIPQHILITAPATNAPCHVAPPDPPVTIKTIKPAATEVTSLPSKRPGLRMLARQALVDAIGADAAQTLIGTFGGKRIYIAVTNSQTKKQSPKWKHIEELLGRDASAKLSASFGGRRFEVPRNPSPAKLALQQRVAELHRQNLRTQDIAAAVGCSRRSVYRILSGKRHAGVAPILAP
jgi:Homeodomain-like domain